MRQTPRVRIQPLFWATFFLCVLAATAPGQGTPAPASNPKICQDGGWPQDASDLRPDPDLHFGRLENGLRYVLMANNEPKNRVALYLNVQAGSLNETDAQRGLAHYLEHMMFNGTTHYPPGTLINYFQSLGMGFGGDTNAHTGYDETVYNLLLPSADPKVLADGFKVLADYARGALLQDGEVDRERGVILAEKRSRDSAASRVAKEELRFDFAGSLVAERDPIGLEEVIIGADSRLLRSYYDRWYRPDNMIVVVVGAIQPQQAAALLQAAFAGVQPVEESGACPSMGQVKESGTDVLVFPDTELGYTGLALNTVYNLSPKADTLAWEVEQLRQYLAMRLLSYRLEQVGLQSGSPLAQPQAHAGLFLRNFGYASLAARTETGRWRESLSLLQTTLDQALQGGFSEAELARGKRELGAMLDKAVQTAPSRDSRQLADDIIRKLNDFEVILSPAQEQNVYAPLIAQLNLSDVNGALQQIWHRPRRLLHLVGVTEPGATPAQLEQQLRELYAANASKPIPVWVDAAPVTFPYLALPRASSPAEVVQEEAVGVERARFVGGVEVQVKRTDFQANQVQISVQFGEGRRAEPMPGMAFLGEAVVKESGVGGLSREQLAAALAGTNVALDLKTGPESFAFTGGCLRQEFETLLQLLRHRLVDPAFTEEGFRRGRDNLKRMYEQMAGTAEGVEQVQGERFLTGGSPEYGLPSWEQVAQVALPSLRAWLVPVFAQAPLEINVVGDIDPQEVIQLVGKYFGDEHRLAAAVPAPTTVSFPAGQTLQLQAGSAIDRSLLTVAWRTGDFWDIQRTRRLNLLAAVFDDRLRVQIREALGATYAPQVVSQPSRAIPGFGLMRASLIVAPDQAASLAQVLREVAASLGRKGVTGEELRRAMEPTLTSIKDIKRNNRYWMESVLNLATRHPQQLQWPPTILEGFAAIKAEELTALAHQYLMPEQAATVIVGPTGEVKASTELEPAALRRVP